MIQSWGTSTENLVRVGAELASMDDRVVVKVPLTREGVDAGAILAKQGASKVLV